MHALLKDNGFGKRDHDIEVQFWKDVIVNLVDKACQKDIPV